MQLLSIDVASGDPFQSWAPAETLSVTGEVRRRCAMLEIKWFRDVDEALRQAKAAGKPVLLDFSAAPT